MHNYVCDFLRADHCQLFCLLQLFSFPYFLRVEVNVTCANLIYENDQQDATV